MLRTESFFEVDGDLLAQLIGQRLHGAIGHLGCHLA